MRRLFQQACPIMNCVNERGARRDSGLCGQRVCTERGDGLPAFSGHCPAGGSDAPAGPLPVGGAGRRGLCRGGVSAGRGLPGRCSGQAGGWSSVGAAGLWRGGEAPANDPAAVCHCLRPGGLCAGPGVADGQHGPGSKRRFLYGHRRQGFAGRSQRGLSCLNGGVPGCGAPWARRRAAPGAGLHRRARHGADRPLGQWKRPSGPGWGAGGAGGGARRPERQPAPGAAPSAVTGAAGISGGPDGSGPAKSAGAAAQAAAIPYGGNACRDASNGADGLGGDRREEV